MTEDGNLPQGWLTPPEANELRYLSRGRTVLELGAWKGRSTVVLSEAAAYVVSVDTHRGIAEVGGDDSLAEYLASVRDLPNVAIVVADWCDLSPLLGHFDLVYVDGNHDLRSVERDTMIALERDPDWIAFHDWDFEEVRDGAALSLGVSDPTRLTGSVASFHRQAWS